MKNKFFIVMIFSVFLLIAPNVQAANFTDNRSVDANKTWTIKFTSNVGLDDLTKEGITVTSSTGAAISVGIQLGEDSKTVNVTAPEGGYTPGESYILNVGSKAHSNKGKALKNEYKLNFNIKNDTDIMPVKTIDINGDSSIMQGNNKFAFDLMKQLTNKDKDKNIIISPLSISTILAETQNGANGQTKDEILSAIGLKNIDDKSINEQYYNALYYYNILTNSVSNSARLRVADSIWVNKNLSLNKGFVYTSKKYYNSEVNSVDFATPDTVGTINQWVDKNTDGQIKQAVNDIDKSAKAILINAISFKGKWQSEFSPNNTKEEDFTLSSGEKVKIDTMQKTDIYGCYLKEDNFQAIQLPYYGGLAMDLFLPDKGVNVNDFMDKATKENFDKWIKNFSSARVNMKIPKFKLEYEEDNMKDVLKNLGMQQAFEPEESNLDGISKNTFISDIIHKTCISVDEKGTDAAAITVVIGCGSVAPPENKVDFVVDRPFVFVIRDCKTGAIIFIGMIENPRG